MKKRVSTSSVFCLASLLAASVASGQAMPKPNYAEASPLSPTERTELEIYRRQSVVVREAIGWKRILELFRPEIERSWHQWVAWGEEQRGTRTQVPAAIMKVEGISLKRFAVAQFPFSKQPLDYTYSLSPDHIAIAHFTDDKDGFSPGSGIEVESWGGYIVGVIVYALDWQKEEQYTYGAYDPAYPERYGLMTYNLFTNEPRRGGAIQLRTLGKTGFEGKFGGGSPPVVIPKPVSEFAQDHYILEFSRAVQIARKKAEAEREAGIMDDDNYEFLKVPLSITWNGQVIGDTTLDRMELDAHRRYFALLESVLH
jgi:hypothetical protein